MEKRLRIAQYGCGKMSVYLMQMRFDCVMILLCRSLNQKKKG